MHDFPKRVYQKRGVSSAKTNMEGQTGVRQIVERVTVLSADFKLDRLTGFLEEIRSRNQFHYWLFGHYHDNRIIDEKYVLLYAQIVQVL